MEEIQSRVGWAKKIDLLHWIGTSGDSAENGRDIEGIPAGGDGDIAVA